MIEQLRQILKKYQIIPQDITLYQTAFTHRSFLNETKEKISSNERLEFLGDAVLSLIISHLLYQNRKNDDEGSLTNLRSFIVKTDSLAKVAQKLHLGDFLKLSKGEEQSGGRNNQQLLANTYEALLGAIFLDLGLDYAQRFVVQTILPTVSQEINYGAPKDYKSQLQELTQEKMRTAPKYQLVASSGPDHAKKFQVAVFVNQQKLGEGIGSNKQQAEEKAAQKALNRLTKQFK